MRRATTPTHTFTFPEDVPVAEVDDVLVTYSQDGANVLEKTKKDLEIDTENNMYIVPKLTQAETNLFAPGKALIQLKAKVGDTVMESQMLWLTVKPALNSGGF